MLQTGFLTATAPLFLDLCTLYYFVLPFLLFASIRFAIKHEYKKHITSQIFIFTVTMIVIVIFETGIRMNGGFVGLIKQSTLPYAPMMYFMVVHIIIAFTSLCMWTYLISSSYVSFKKNALIKHHVILGRLTFIGIASSCIMGVVIYYLIFVLK